MEVVLAVIIIVIIGTIISSINKSASRHSNMRQYYKAIDNSTGLEKIRLTVRKDAVRYSNLFQHDNNNESFLFLLTPMLKAQITISDIFFGQIQEILSKVKPELDEILSDTIQDNGGASKVSVRIFAIGFGIMLKKSADESKKKINQTNVKKYIATCKLNEEAKKEIGKYAIITIKHLNGIFADSPMVSYEMSELVSGLLCYKYEKENFADPVYLAALSSAMKVCYDRMNVNSYISDLRKANLIR